VRPWKQFAPTATQSVHDHVLSSRFSEGPSRPLKVHALHAIAVSDGTGEHRDVTRRAPYVSGCKSVPAARHPVLSSGLRRYRSQQGRVIAMTTGRQRSRHRDRVSRLLWDTHGVDPDQVGKNSRLSSRRRRVYGLPRRARYRPQLCIAFFRFVDRGHRGRPGPCHRRRLAVPKLCMDLIHIRRILRQVRAGDLQEAIHPARARGSSPAHRGHLRISQSQITNARFSTNRPDFLLRLCLPIGPPFQQRAERIRL
jgi:hypothetical protein